MVDIPQKFNESDAKYAERLLPYRDAEIDRLKSEVKRLNKNLKYHVGLAGELLSKRDTTHNAALEEAAALSNTSVNDGGLAKSMAFFVDVADYKSYKQSVSDYAAAIRSLKRPTS